MKPEEQVRAAFEAHIKQEWGYVPEPRVMNDGSEEYVGADQERYEYYSAAYAQARREALEEAAACAWQTLMDEARKRGLSPSSPITEGWFQVPDSIRALIKD